MKPITKFKTKKGKEVKVHLPTLEKISMLVEFINRLIDEDTFLSLTGKHKTFEEEENFVKNSISNMKAGRSFIIWAFYNNKMVGECSLNSGFSERDSHVGNIGLMVDKDFRRDGIGKFLFEYILKQAQRMKIKVTHLDVFAENEPAINLYKKYSFEEYGRLPKGLFRQGKYSDQIKMYKNI
jgi:RimJ/RimL family protein N-acetyltransferase